MLCSEIHCQKILNRNYFLYDRLLAQARNTLDEVNAMQETSIMRAAAQKVSLATFFSNG